MRLLSFRTAVQLEAAAGSWLATDGRTNNLILSRLKAAIQHGGPADCSLVVAADEPQMALLAASPHAVLSGGSARAAEFLAKHLEVDIPQFVGPADAADAFAAHLIQKTGRAGHVNMQMTFYTLDRAEPFSSPAGSLRPATPEEFHELAPLAVAAEQEMHVGLPVPDPAAIETTLRQAIDEGQQFVWQEGPTIRAIASYVTALDHAGARIRGVYTPPAFRGRGFGTAITGALAGRLLSTGQAWVALFADNANPTSTGIYRRLGFQPHSVFRTWRFTCKA